MEKISWNTIEYLHTEKTTDWYWIVGIITLSIALISIILNNIIFAILIVVSSFTLSLFASRKPEIINIDITESGIKIGKNMYPYSSLKAFWINDYGDFGNLLLRSSGVINPLISIPIIKIDPEKIREILLEYIREEEIIEPLSQKIMEYLGF